MSNDEDLNNLRHSCAHLLAAAVKELWPGTHNAIGPSIENGFYQDFDFGKVKISEEDLPKIEKKMQEMVQNWGPFKVKEVTPEQARIDFASNPYKLELIEEFAKEGKTLTENDPGNFLDLCKGGHVEGEPKKELKHFKLLSLAGAYWRGSEKNKMLTRIYGTCFPNKEELDKYLWQLEEAKKRDHRKLGTQLGLWTFSDLVGPGLPLFTQKGALVRQQINEFVESLQSKQGIAQVWTPQIAKAELFKISGHYDKYSENMFEVKSHYSKEEFFLKPMNCPQHTQIFASTHRSYRDLPIRMADFAMLYRDEKVGELMGLARTRSFSQDDCHVFCREDQITEEANKALDMTKQIMEAYGFEYRYRLSLRDPQHPEKYIGDEKIWQKAEKLSEQILKDRGVEYFVGIGEAAFYGPKLDLIATDSIGREWQLSTLQIDFFMPDRFGLTYIDEQGKEQKPVMLHRAISGSPERLMAILLEHFNGALPVWLSPTQVQIIPIADRHQEYAQKVLEQLITANIRVEVDNRAEKMQAKIRDAQLQKIPYMIIIGDREEKENKVAVRTREGKDLGAIDLAEFLGKIKQEVESKT